MLLLYNNLLDTATLTASSEATGFPADNLKNPFRTKCWKTAGTIPGVAQLVVDFGSAQTIDAIALTGYDWATKPGKLVVEFNATNVWTAPSATEVLTWHAPTTPGGNKGSIILKLAAAQTYRYARLNVISSAITLTNGSSGGAIDIDRSSLASGTWLNTYATAFDTFSSSASDSFTASDASGKTGICVRVPITVTKGRRYVLSLTPTFTENTTLTAIYFSDDYYSGHGKIIATSASLVSGKLYTVEGVAEVSGITSLMLVITVAAGASMSISGFSIKEMIGLDPGAGDFTLIWKGALPDWTPSAAVNLISKGTSLTNGYTLRVETTGKISLRLCGTTYTSSAAPTVTNGETLEIAAAVTVGAVNTTVDFYVNGAALGTQQTAANPGTVSTTGDFKVMSTYAGTARYAVSNLTNVSLYNRGLTSADILAHYTAEAAAAGDQWGAGIASYSSDFSAGADGWTANEGTATGNIDSIGGVYNNLQFYPSAVASSAHYCQIASKLTAGYRTRVYFEYYIPATCPNTKAISLQQSSADIFGTTGAWGSTYYEFVPIISGLRFYARTGAGSAAWTGAGDASDAFYVRNVLVVKVGAVLALEMAGITATDWQDSSSNNLDAAYPVSGITTGVEDFSLGRLFLGQYFEPERNYSYGYREAITDPSIISQTIGGQKHADESERYRTFSASGQLCSQAQWVLFQEMINTVGIRKPFFVALDYDNDPEERTLYGHFTGLPSVTRELPGLWSYSFSVEEDR